MHLPRLTTLLTVIILSICASACTPIVENRGKPLDPEDIQKVSVHKHSKNDVLKILGSPTYVDPYSSNKWYYVSQIAHRKAFFRPEEKDFKLVTVVFNAADMLEEVSESDKDHVEDLKMVQRETKTSGKDMGNLEQIFGNFGRFQRQGEASTAP